MIAIVEFMELQVACIIGESGVGKTSVVDRLMELHSEMYHKTISATTRPQRDGEVNGVHYHFMTHEDFLAGVERDEFIEHEIYNGHYYGTPYSELSITGKIALRVVEDEGARSLKDKIGARVCGIVAPSNDELRRRLELRGDSETDIEARLIQDAERDSIIRALSDFVIINDDLTIAADMLHRHLHGDMTLTEQEL